MWSKKSAKKGSMVPVIIPAAGLGTRLGDYTKEFNKASLPIGSKSIINHIIDYYPSFTQTTNKNFDWYKILLVLGYKKEFLYASIKLGYGGERVFPYRAFPFYGTGSSTLFSILSAYNVNEAMNHVKRPFIIHMADTLIHKYNVPRQFDYNWLICVSDWPRWDSNYSIVEQRGETAIQIRKKAKRFYASDAVYIGVAGIYDWEAFWNIGIDLYLEDPADRTLSDVDVFNEMIERGHKFKVIDLVDRNRWFDIGTIAGYERACKFYNPAHQYNKKALPKVKNQYTFVLDKKVIKTFPHHASPVYLINRANNQLKGFAPTTTHLNQIKETLVYDKIPGKTLSDVIIPEITLDFLRWFDGEFKGDIKPYRKEYGRLTYDFYIQKSLDRIARFHRINPKIKDVNCYVNGIYVPSADYCVKLLNRVDFLVTGVNPQRWHGDMVIENIIVGDDGKFHIIDWREHYAKSTKDGDVYYDLAKFNHSLIMSHETLVDRNFTVDKTEKDGLIHYNIDFFRRDKLIECKQVFDNWIKSEKKYSLEKIEVITGLIWMNMSPLHALYMQEFLFVYGRYYLYKNLRHFFQQALRHE